MVELFLEILMRIALVWGIGTLCCALLFAWIIARTRPSDLKD